MVSPGWSSHFACFRWVNTIIRNTKTAMTCTCHEFLLSKYARSYLTESQYLFNRRFNLEALVPRSLYVCLQNDPRGLQWIRVAE
jgi:hypothetical protein